MKRDKDQVLTEWLVLTAQSGNASAMDRLLRIWQPRWLRYARHQLRSQDGAEDVVQDAMLSIARRIRRLDDPAAFPRWAYQVLHRRGVDHIRREMRLRKRKDALGRDPTRQQAAPSTAALVETSHSAQRLLGELDGISSNILQLFYLDELSHRDIASICNIPIGTVKSRLNTARKKLRKQLDENHE